MLPTDRFVVHELRNHGYLQPDCPAYVHCTRQCKDRRSGARFLQLRLVNRGDRTIETVIFDLEGLDANGEVQYAHRGLVMAKCSAPPKKTFGEERMFVLEPQRVEHLRVRVKRVVFSDGMIWRELPEHRLTTVEKAGWRVCRCAMPNPPEREFCDFCGEALEKGGEQQEEPCLSNVQISPPPAIPAPIVRRERPVRMIPPVELEEDDEDGVPAWLTILLCIFGMFAILALLAFGIFYFRSFIL